LPQRLRKVLGRLTVTGLAAALLSGGCSSFNRPYPDKALFALDLGPPPHAATWSTGAAAGDTLPARAPAPTLRVRSVRIAQPFDTTTFVYKVGASRFTTDYYNGFIAEPDRLLTGQLLRWLTASGEFSAVVPESSTADYRMTLETQISALYGDYTIRASPQAVLELQMWVIEDAPSSSRVVFQKTYREAEPLSANTPEQLVGGWGTAYRRILTRFLTDLRAAPQVTSPGDSPSR
jgi:cholesterol transport system auxiliary component